MISAGCGDGARPQLNSRPMAEPHLLVSVRSATEAIALRDSGVRIIDVKEPDRGPLGKADPLSINEIADVLPLDCQMSVALGEASEFDAADKLPERVQYLKLGLAGLGDDPGWQQCWLDARVQAGGCMGKRAAWVAVIYADFETARAPEPEAIVDAAINTGCAVVLVDTFEKRPRTDLFESLSVGDLARLRVRTNHAGMVFAIAGQLRTNHAESIRAVEPNIVGIRGAACRWNDRKSIIDPNAVAEFRQSLRQPTVKPG